MFQNLTRYRPVYRAALVRRYVTVAPWIVAPFWRVLPVLLAAATAVAGPVPPDASQPPTAGTEVELQLADGGSVRALLVAEHLELTTKYGVLKVPTGDVNKIVLATRSATADQERVTRLIAQLGHDDFKAREGATADLKEMAERAYPILSRGRKHADPEVARRIEEVMSATRTRIPAARLELRDRDEVHTTDSKFVGQLTGDHLTVTTLAFGTQDVKLSALRGVTKWAATEQALAPPPAPGNMSAYTQQFGKEWTFTVTGQLPAPGASVSVWGTDQYTLDSSLAAAAVHAGVVRPGASATVRVRVIQSPAQFVSSFRNEVTSTAYGQYTQGAYEFVRK